MWSVRVKTYIHRVGSNNIKILNRARFAESGKTWQRKSPKLRNYPVRVDSS